MRTVARPMPKAKKPARPSFPIPWGLGIVLAVYAAGVYAYIKYTYWEAPEYQAAVHYAKAIRLLGVDDGRKCTQQELERALDHILEAAKLVPEEKGFADESERLRWRFEERHFKLPEEFRRRMELVSSHAQRIDQERQAWLVVSQRDKGWAPDQVLAGPERTLWIAVPGGALIIAFWAYTRFSGRAVREREKEEGLKEEERELQEMGKFRAGLAGAESKVRQILEEAEREEEEGGATSVQPMFQPKKRPTVYRPLSHAADDEAPGTSDTEEDPATRRRPPSLATPAVRRPPTGQIPAVKKSVIEAVADEDAKTAEDPVEPVPRPRQASQARPAVSRGAPVSSATAPPPKRKG